MPVARISNVETAATLGALEYAFVAATEADLAAVRAEPAPDAVVDAEADDLEGEEP